MDCHLLARSPVKHKDIQSGHYTMRLFGTHARVISKKMKQNAIAICFLLPHNDAKYDSIELLKFGSHNFACFLSCYQDLVKTASLVKSDISPKTSHRLARAQTSCQVAHTRNESWRVGLDSPRIRASRGESPTAQPVCEFAESSLRESKSNLQHQRLSHELW